MPSPRPLRLAFAGTPDFAARHLAALIDSRHCLRAVLTQPDRPAGRGQQARAGPVKTLALEAGLPVLQPASLRDPEAVAGVAALQLDALIVVAYGLILPAAVLDLPRLGAVNVHGSLLPRWRGAAPIQRAIEAGDRESGVAVMHMDAGLDTGPVVAVERCAIPPLATSGELYAQLAAIGPRLLLNVLEDLPGALAQARAQDETRACYAAKIDKREAQLDWRLPASALARRIRAFNPAPGCFTDLGGQRLKIWRARAAPAGGADCGASGSAEVSCSEAGDARINPIRSSGMGTAGTIEHVGPDSVSVRCGEGLLRLERAQLPGARAMDLRELLRGRAERFALGTVLGAGRSA